MVRKLAHLWLLYLQVFAGAKPFLEKAISSLVEALMNELVNIFTETSTTVFHRLDLNGYCQLMLEVGLLPSKFTPTFFPSFCAHHVIWRGYHVSGKYRYPNLQKGSKLLPEPQNT